MNTMTLTLEQFFENFKPTTNPFTTHADFDNRLFGIRGKEQETVYQTDPRFIWTLLNTDGEQYLVPGRYFVNREGYFVTTVEYNGSFLEIPVNEE